MTQHAAVFKLDEDTLKTGKNPLSVREILTMASETPVESYYLVRIERDRRTEMHRLDELVELHDGDRFAAVFGGPGSSG